MAFKGRSLTKADKERYVKLQEFGCVVCMKYLDVWSPAAIHHIDGKVKPGAHQKTIPLCGAHHQGPYGTGLHAGKAEFERKFDTEMNLLKYVNGLI